MRTIPLYEGSTRTLVLQGFQHCTTLRGLPLWDDEVIRLDLTLSGPDSGETNRRMIHVPQTAFLWISFDLGAKTARHIDGFTL